MLGPRVLPHKRLRISSRSRSFACRRALGRAALASTLVAAAGCGSQPAAVEPAAAWRSLAMAEFSPAQQATWDQLLAARDALAGQLKTRLGEALGTGGPAGAIGVCAEAAPQLAEEVSAAHGVKLGRTSFRLRNPRNAAPAWAGPLLERQVTEPAALTDGERLAALLPIRVQPECLLCHGARDEMPAELLTALAERYPEDQATGFAAGDLRGYFWVESLPEK
jgi:hypothetical protein